MAAVLVLHVAVAAALQAGISVPAQALAATAMTLDLEPLPAALPVTEPPKPQHPPPVAPVKPQPVRTQAQKASPAAKLPVTEAAEIPATAPIAPSQPSQAASPSQSSPAAAPSNAAPTWQALLMAHLERHKQYPRAAQQRRQEGVVRVAFIMDRQGRVLAVDLRQSSGHRLLDDESIELLTRAQPLPAPPPEVGGHTIQVQVPVQFTLR